MASGGPINDAIFWMMKTSETEGFGKRLAELRRRRGLTQAELGKAVGVSQRVIAYYETESRQVPGALLADLAKALRTSADVLVGLKESKDDTSPRAARLLKRLSKVAEFSPADQRTVLKLVEALAETQRRPRSR